MKSFRAAALILTTLMLIVTAVTAANAQVFTTLADFAGDDGSGPWSLVQGTDGNFYSTTQTQGAYGGGTAFKVTPEGALTAIYGFCAGSCSDGRWANFGLILGIDGNFYGTNTFGGAYGQGTAFKITPDGTLTTLHSFCSETNCTDGSEGTGLIQGTDGNIYGTTGGGGAAGQGTFFRITPAGTLTTLFSFCAQTNCTDGSLPWAALLQATDGNFYGVTQFGGNPKCGSGNGCGTVFRITPSGTLTTLHRFCTQTCNDGTKPMGALVQATDGSFYGTTSTGGANGDGTVFKMTPSGTLTTLYSSCAQANCADGTHPQAGLVQATDGNFYGTATAGGNPYCSYNHGCGTVFEITPDGILTTLYSFGGQADGSYPWGALIQSTNGTLYGAAANYPGTIFSLSMGLNPFVSFVHNPAKVGGSFGILGQGLTGTTSVSLNGTPAKFTVRSDTLILAAVPAGVTTGPVTVTTSSGTLTSNVPFRVMPQLLSFSPPSGPVGTQVTITGVSLTQTTGVGFGDRKPASFTVKSDTQVTATVPTGAKTGPVGIETQGGIAISSGMFTVTQ
ncbi:exported hypothetical protein [Candidatus Sulfotelmatobacter kueseliae]|uniref:IPT/TIG domain-containing protein n=1 Tax=Candidatus Sulfotelmatobacter kueseliae TaxID=2042962 RepID=A0A2U3K039_9BACT|nr:exported hypothetical protein [Candidatus Sulfotelmatobacter kueseliae]